MDYTNFNIEDFLTNESFVNYCYDTNDDDKKHWENVILTQPLLKKQITEARELCLLLGIKVSKAEKQQALNNLKKAIEREQLQSTNITKGKVRRLWFARIAVAAALLVFAMVYSIYKYTSPVSGAVLYSRVTDASYHIVARTNFNGRKKVALPDGTIVILNGASTLKMANDYNNNSRHVVLTGEAFFEVHKDKDRPFVVLTSKTATTALGTSFKVSSYSTLKTASVMLVTGKVKVESTRPHSNINDQILVPGQQVTLADGASGFIKSNFNTTKLQNWIDGRLIFSNANFAEIAAKIADIYGVQVAANSKDTSKIKFTGQFDNKSLTEVLDAIGFVNNFTYRQKDDRIKIVF
ncbi:hypothetical protein GCM10023149_07530 [Mucilaginibacter gynuensis]|uniref:FecR family protein n=1 Tax=Mucilaginibacter gynuensis TaxID=1302236 RepID=A0ABP8FWA1_9SPHI